LPDDQVVGLVTIRPMEKLTALRKNIWKYYGGAVFFRDGSMSMPKVFDIEIKDVNSKIVEAIENHAQNNIELTLNGVFDFMEKRRDYHPTYLVFQEYFVLCWSGLKKQVKNEVFYSRVDIELINEQVKLFYSALDEVAISYSNNTFEIVEYVRLGLNQSFKYYKLEHTTIRFTDSASYQIDSQLIFEPPQFDKKVLHHIYNANNALLKKLEKGMRLTEGEQMDLNNLAASYLICYLNGFPQAIDKLTQCKSHLKAMGEALYQSYKEATRILRKVKYN
jgi:hypothetical protein